MFGKDICMECIIEWRENYADWSIQDMVLYKDTEKSWMDKVTHEEPWEFVGAMLMDYGDSRWDN